MNYDSAKMNTDEALLCTCSLNILNQHLYIGS